MSNTPQFSTAEYTAKSGDRCKSCNQPVTGEYFRVNGAMACATCAEAVRQNLPKDSHAAFARAMLFGAGGAIAGLIIYATFSIITGLIIGYVSLAVGYIVGKAMMAGSKNIGGRRYQVAAVVFTYFAVSLASIPVWIADASKTQRPASHARANDDRAVQAPQADSDDADDSSAQPEPSRPPRDVGAIIGTLLMLGLISPFLGLQHSAFGLIGLFILFIGLRIAWRITAERPLEVIGPFKVAPAPG